jgi:predicted alpha/beta superfamily hydrolase
MLHELPDIVGPGEATRTILVATPPGYDDDPVRRYPVVYLQDGQNLFDPATAYAGHWHLLETLQERGEDFPAILVGIPNLGTGRILEYAPFDDSVRGEGNGEEYVRWIVSTVKPLVDRTFRTRTDQGSTIIGGSSMGGLISLYGHLARPEVFGAAWVMSPALWYADGEIFRWIGSLPRHHSGTIWLDVGLNEGEDAVFDVRTLRDLLLDRGWVMGRDLRYMEDPEGDHNEESWATRTREHWLALPGIGAVGGNAGVQRERETSRSS